MMFPVIFDLSRLPVALIGNNEMAVKRLRQLDESGATQVTVYADAPNEALRLAAADRLIKRLPALDDLSRASLAMVAGLDEETSRHIHRMAQQLLIPVNVEDVTPLCDFHFPALVRRGDLLLTVSTGGKSPALARTLRDYLAGLFGEEWSANVNDIATYRSQLKAAGSSLGEALTRTADYIYDQGWLPKPKAKDRDSI